MAPPSPCTGTSNTTGIAGEAVPASRGRAPSGSRARSQNAMHPLLVLLALIGASGLAQSPARTLLPVYVESALRQPPLLTSVLLAVQLACGGLFALAGGAVSDRLGRRTALLVGLSTSLFGSALLLAQAPVTLLALAVLWGLTNGFHSTGSQAYLISVVDRARLGTSTAVFFICTTASQALGSYLGGRAADAAGYAPVALAAVVVGALSLAAGALWLPGNADRPRHVVTEAALNEHGPSRSREDTSSVDTRHQELAGPGLPTSGYTHLLRRPEVLALGALRYLPTTAWGVATLALPLLMVRAGGTAGTVGLFGMVSLLAASGAQIATGRVIDRFDRRGGSARPLTPPLTAAIGVTALAATLWGAGVPALFLVGTVWTMVAWALSTTFPPLIHELGAGREDGRLVGLMHLLWSGGMLTGTLAAGLLVDLHPSLPFALATGCLVASFLVAMWFTRTRPRAVVGAALEGTGLAPV